MAAFLIAIMTSDIDEKVVNCVVRSFSDDVWVNIRIRIFICPKLQIAFTITDETAEQSIDNDLNNNKCTVKIGRGSRKKTGS